MMKITLILKQEHIDAIEENFFCDLTDDAYEETVPYLHDIWDQICEQTKGLG